MKKLVVLLLVLVCAGCAPTQLRTGPLVVNKFEVAGFKTDNPFYVKRDAVETMRDDLHKAILRYVATDTKFNVVNECSENAWELVGRFEEINAKIESHWRFVTISVNNEFDVSLDGHLQKCGSAQKIAEFELDESGDNMSDIIDEIGENVVYQVKNERIPAPTK